MRVKLSDIIKDHNTQCRASIDTEVVNEYAERMSEGDVFPPVVLIGYGKSFFIGDGWHRIAAAEQIGAKDIEADFTEGTREDAIKYALHANVANGLRRTNADKRRCVEVALKEFGDLSSRAIAELCGVSDFMVNSARPQVLENGTSTEKPTVKGKDGKNYPSKRTVTITANDIAQTVEQCKHTPSPKQTAVEREEAEYLETVTEKTETKEVQRTRDPTDTTKDADDEESQHDSDSPALFHLKRYWNMASKKDKTQFKRWINED